jgi:hypothetical protein
MRKAVLVFLFLFLCKISSAQRVGALPVILRLENYSTNTNDGLLTFEIDVRMADCIHYIEIIDVDKIKKDKNTRDKLHDWWWFKVRKIYDFSVSKTFTKKIHEDDYFLKDLKEGAEHIFMKCNLLQLKSVFGRKTFRKRLEINVYSLSGKKIYSKTFILDKNKLIEDGEIVLTQSLSGINK